MTNPRYNPYKYASIVLAILTIILFSLSPDVTIPYCILTGALIVYLGIKIITKLYDYKSFYGFIGYFSVYIVIAALTLGPIFYLVVPHFANKYISTTITIVGENEVNDSHTFLWNGPIKGTMLSADEKYIYNDSDEPIFLISAPYVHAYSKYPYFGSGLQLIEKIEPKEIIKNNYKIYSYLKLPPDSIKVTVGRHGRNLPYREISGSSSSSTFYFIVNKEQYNQLWGYEDSFFD